MSVNVSVEINTIQVNEAFEYEMKALFFGKSAISIQEVPVSYRVNGVRESSMILFFRKIAHRHHSLYI